MRADIVKRYIPEEQLVIRLKVAAVVVNGILKDLILQLIV